ncbi:MAG: hypothetical protein WKG03_02235 [Telluria sp.]
MSDAELRSSLNQFPGVSISWKRGAHLPQVIIIFPVIGKANLASDGKLLTGAQWLWSCCQQMSGCEQVAAAPSLSLGNSPVSTGANDVRPTIHACAAQHGEVTKVLARGEACGFDSLLHHDYK